MNNSGERTEFINYLFNNAGLLNSNYNEINKRRLIVVLIEERNALSTNDYMNRWYDPIIAPGSIIRSIEMPEAGNIAFGENIELSLTTGKETVTDYIIPQEEKEHIRWKYEVSNHGKLSIPNSDGKERCSLVINRSWAGKKLTITAYVDGAGTNGLWQNDIKTASILIPKIQR